MATNGSQAVFNNFVFFRNWPLGRSIFHDHSRDFVVWVNESDHVVIKSMDKRGNVRRAASRLVVPLVASVLPDRVWPQGRELVPPAVVVDVCLADDGHGVEVCFFFFF